MLKFISRENKENLRLLLHAKKPQYEKSDSFNNVI